MGTMKAGGYPQNQRAQPKSNGRGPSVSVVVPAYNVEDYIVTCVDSLERQTYGSLEIVVVDDGSKDATGELLEGLAEIEGSRLKIISQPNGGPSAARNNGLAASSGELVCFVDGDDQVAPTMIAALVEALVQTQADIASCGQRTYPPGSTPEWPDFPYRVDLFRGSEALVETLYYRGVGLGPCAKLCRREVWENHAFPPVRLGEDMATIPSVVADCSSAARVDARLYGVAVRPGSITRASTVPMQKVGDLRDAVLYCAAGEPTDASQPLRAAFRACKATELCRVINLSRQVVDEKKEAARVHDVALSELRSIAATVILDRHAPTDVRLRVALGAYLPWAYPLARRIKRMWEGWL